jgi:hypothetical protein
MRIKKIGKASKGAVRNATKVEYDGIKFDSKLEQYAYAQLKLFKIHFTMKQKFVIFDGFRYGDEAIRPISWTPDYILPHHNIILETKGFANDQWSLKIKLIKKYFLNKVNFIYDYDGIAVERNLLSPKIVICKSQKEVNAFIAEIIK